MAAGGLSRSSEEAVYLGKNDQTFVDVLVAMLCIAHRFWKKIQPPKKYPNLT
jgi:hypothetical protein